VFVDDNQQARQIGETQWAPETPCIELGDILTGKVNIVRAPSDITVFDMTGIALQDLTVARMLQDSALAADAGACIDWPW
jgi:ornithine cyclodeaminase